MQQIRKEGRCQTIRLILVDIIIRYAYIYPLTISHAEIEIYNPHNPISLEFPVLAIIIINYSSCCEKMFTSLP